MLIVVSACAAWVAKQSEEAVRLVLDFVHVSRFFWGFSVADYKMTLETFGTPLLVFPKVFSNCSFLFPPGLQVPEEGF